MPPEGAALAALAAAPDEGGPLDWPAAAEARLASAGDAAVAAWLAQLSAMLEGCESLEEYRARLLAAYPALDAAPLAGALSLAGRAAQLAGALDVADEAGL